MRALPKRCMEEGWNETMAKDLNMSNLLDFYGALLTDKQNEAINFYYNEDLSLGEISDIMKITRQGVRDHVKKGEGSLSYFEEKLQLNKKFADLQMQCKKIAEVVNSVIDYNQKYLFSAEITKQMENISVLVNELIEKQVN